MDVNLRKIAIVGCGAVGAATAFSLMESGLYSEIVMVDVNKDKAEGEAMDILHGTSLITPMRIYAGSYEDIADAAVIVITAGAAQKPGETRLDLIHKNIAIFNLILKEIRRVKPKGILLVVANPVDILTYYTARMSGLPERRVFGSGTVLDTARLRTLIGSKLNVDSRSVHAFVIGEHGDSEIVTWSHANISGVPLPDFYALRGMNLDDLEKIEEEIGNDVRNSAYEIIRRKGATCYGIGVSVRRICSAIVKDEKSILPVSTVLHGTYAIEGCALSVPAIVGQEGVEGLVPVAMSETERINLLKSAEILKQNMADITYD